MGYIYKITNDINGKIYIGKTEHINPEDRWNEHLKDYEKKRNEKRPLYEAMNKYGVEHFHFEVIEETDIPEEREKYWIHELRTYIGFEDCRGYNATLGGDGKSYLNLNEDEVIKYHTEEAIFILNNTAKYFNVDNGTIKKILQKHNIHWMKHGDVHCLKCFLKRGSINQINIIDKHIVNKYRSVTEAAKELHLSKESLFDACNNRRGKHYAHGYMWYYEKDMQKAVDNGDYLK